MATPVTGFQTCTIVVNLFSGARDALSPDVEPLLTVRDGNQNTVTLPDNGFLTASWASISGLPFFDNFGDNYAVVASANDHEQAGFFPVKVTPDAPAVVDLMLLNKNADYNFRDARWDKLKLNHADYAALLSAGTADEATAANRYSDRMEQHADCLACFFNLATAMSQIHLPDKTPMAYIKEIIWDETFAQDRFFAWADPAVIDQVARAAAQKQFTPEVGTALFHAGATRSWKQVQFGEANVQLTFHENDRKEIGGVQCVMIEPDIDYYKDLAAHALLEVITNKLTNSLSNPRQVYVLRWIAGRHAGIPNFDPPYTIE